jgi:hypothetical protein
MSNDDVGTSEQKIAAVEQKLSYIWGTKDVGGKEQIIVMIEWNTIYTRNGDVRGKEQIKAVKKRNNIYMRNGDVGSREQNKAVMEQKISSIWWTDM